MVFPVLCFVAGAALGPSTEGSGWPFLTGALALLLFSWRWPGVGRWLALLGGMLLGGLALSTFEARISVPPVGKEAQLEGEVEQVDGNRLTLRLSALDRGPARGRVLLHVEGPLTVLAGQRVMASARLKSLEYLAS
ncbi:MAG: hypothetical protein H6Q89_1830, partial [Myxococcaceae bacterium]|nr:hypothetical protein [Myxococcaceae bacterium]